MGRSVDRREATSIASTCNWPCSASRPCTHCAPKPWLDKASWPSARMVFQGVPRPVSSSAGHCERWSCMRTCTPPQRGSKSSARGVCMQQSANTETCNWPQPGCTRQARRPGKVLLSLLPGPPVRVSCVEPFHTVPRASCSSTWPPLVACTRPASQTAGANSTVASSKPSTAPKKAQPQGVRAGANVEVRAIGCGRSGRSGARDLQHDAALPKPLALRQVQL